MIKAGVIGGAGYTGGELLRILVNHPDVEIEFVNSNSNAGNKLYTVHEGLIGETDMVFTDHSRKSTFSSRVSDTATRRSSWSRTQCQLT